MITLEYPKLLNLFPEHCDPKRNESASFLIWYFENYLRLESIDALDAVCDQRGDKGVDGIYVSEDSNTIEIYQSKLSQRSDATIGDTPLKEFAGTLLQFANRNSLEAMMNSAGAAEVSNLIRRLDLLNKIGTYEIRGVFVCNSELDNNGRAFLASQPTIKFVGRSTLENTYLSPKRDLPISEPAQFDVSGYEVATYYVSQTNNSLIAPLKASELVKMKGIADQSIFAYNVRGPLGRTQVNKDIAASIRDKSKHKLFPLFHNGITITADSVEADKDKITLQNYYVVNGCQSLSALYSNSTHLSEDLRVLAKIIKIDISSGLSEMITQFSNNQNGVKARDFKSNNPIQIRLQNEFKSAFGKEFHYEVKRGEDNEGLETITNEAAGLYLMSFDLKEPWATHRKYQVFEEKYSELFGRPGVSADKITLCHLIAGRIDAALRELNNSLFAKYILSKFLILYVVRLILEQDTVGRQILEKPEDFVRSTSSRPALIKAIDAILDDVIIDLNHELGQLGDEFDYRGKLRDEKWSKELAHRLVADHEKLVKRERIPSFGDQYRAV